MFVDSVESGNIALEEIEQFGKFAGHKLNLTKTNAITMIPQNECLQRGDHGEIIFFSFVFGWNVCILRNKTLTFISLTSYGIYM